MILFIALDKSFCRMSGIFALTLRYKQMYFLLLFSLAHNMVRLPLTSQRHTIITVFYFVH